MTTGQDVRTIFDTNDIGKHQSVDCRKSVQRLRSREPYRFHIGQVDYQRRNVRILMFDLRFR